MKRLLLAAPALVALASIATAPAFSYDDDRNSHNVKIQKTIPTELLGEWCHNNSDNYQLPSWAETPEICGKKDQILSISDRSFSAYEIYCDVVSKVTVEVDCAPSGCGSKTTFTALCYRGDNPNTKWRRHVEFNRYKGNLYFEHIEKPWKAPCVNFFSSVRLLSLSHSRCLQWRIKLHALAMKFRSDGYIPNIYRVRILNQHFPLVLYILRMVMPKIFGTFQTANQFVSLPQDRMILWSYHKFRGGVLLHGVMVAVVKSATTSLVIAIGHAQNVGVHHYV